MSVPTSRKRHTITETTAVEQALAPLRARGVAVDFADLVARGAAAKLRELDAGAQGEQRREALREAFLERTRTGAGLDLDAAPAVREGGWTGV